MSSTGLEVFDKTLKTTNIWLDGIMADAGTSRNIAWHALGAVLQTLRDRLPITLAAHLGVQLPLLIRGAYYDRWQPTEQPDKLRTREEFLQRIDDELSRTKESVNTTETVHAVFAVLSQHIDPGQVEKVRQALPEDIRTMW